MSLDIRIENDDFYGWRIVKIEAGMHDELMEKISSADFPIFKKMDDFYKNARFEVNELPVLIKEIDLIIPLFSGDKDITLFLLSLKELANEAIKQKKKLLANAD